MRRLYKLLIMFTLALFNLSVQAEDSIPILKIKQKDLPVKIVLREALSDVLKDQFLYGDIIKNGQTTNTYGGEKSSRFQQNWPSKEAGFHFERDSIKGVCLLVDKELPKGYIITLQAKIAKNEGDEEQPNWYPAYPLPFKVEIVEDASTTMQDGDNHNLDEDEEDSLKFSNADWILFGFSVIYFGLIFFLFVKKKEKKGTIPTPRVSPPKDFTQEISNLQQNIKWLKDQLPQRYLTEDDVRRIVRESVPVQKKGVRETVTTKPAPLKKIETFDTVEYSFQENKFVITSFSQQIFLITRNDNDYTFTLKNKRVCEEIMPMLNAYSKCITVQGNTSSANGIGEITPGVLYPTGDGRTYTIASPIVIKFI